MEKIIDNHRIVFYSDFMAKEKLPRYQGRTKVSIPFTDEEDERFQLFLTSTGRKAGPWLRVVALKLIEQEASQEASA